jgi:hypothetical protein
VVLLDRNVFELYLIRFFINQMYCVAFIHIYMCHFFLILRLNVCMILCILLDVFLNKTLFYYILLINLKVLIFSFKFVATEIKYVYNYYLLSYYKILKYNIKKIHQQVKNVAKPILI